MGCETSSEAQALVPEEEAFGEAIDPIGGMKGGNWTESNGNRKGNDQAGNQGYGQAQLDERQAAAVKIQSAARQKVTTINEPLLISMQKDQQSLFGRL